MSNLVAVIACPTGIAHTIMAEEALRQAADRTGHQLRVETQSAAGTRNTLDAHDIAAADAVIVAADVNVNTDRFAGKPILSVGTIPVIRDAEGLIRQALGQAGRQRTAEQAAGDHSLCGLAWRQARQHRAPAEQAAEQEGHGILGFHRGVKQENPDEAVGPGDQVGQAGGGQQREQDDRRPGRCAGGRVARGAVARQGADDPGADAAEPA